MLSRACVVLLALPLLGAGANRYYYRTKDATANPTAKVPQFIVADTEADLPSTDVREGDVGYAKDTDSFWNRTESAWVAVAGGGGGAPTTATYITQTPNAGLSAEQALSVLGSGLVLNANGTGVLSIFGGTSCTNQFPRSLDASGAATCATVGDADISALATSKLTGSVTDAQVPDTISLTSLTQVATRQISDTTGTLAVSRGGTGGSPASDDQVLVSDSSSAATWRLVPDCDNATTSKLLYDQATNAWSCGTDQTGGGGGSANVVEVEVDFGAAGNTNAAVVVTGQAWVTATSKIVCAPTLLGTADRAEGAEDAIIEGVTASFHTRVVGTGFTVAAAARQGRFYGRIAIHCHGA